MNIGPQFDPVVTVAKDHLKLSPLTLSKLIHGGTLIYLSIYFYEIDKKQILSEHSFETQDFSSMPVILVKG